ncbi:MAG: hypothetical protein WCB55_15955, partial [Pseudolabrys sp.]
GPGPDLGRGRDAQIGRSGSRCSARQLDEPARGQLPRCGNTCIEGPSKRFGGEPAATDGHRAVR